ncbi:MAG TPA: tRNA (adenosine(37)-N6)-dimethylallyltransferase MiaA [Candidatus Paceibacterota bacterium]
MKRIKLPKIVVILGPTAVGKSDSAVQLAKRFNGEVVSADSRQVYKGLTIGTGKITRKEMKGIRHHLLDVAKPQKQFTVTQYVTLAKRAVEDILSRGKLPIICGGTGFYISALLGNETIPDVPPNPSLRKKLKKKTVAELFVLLTKFNRKRADMMNESDRQNPHRLIRAIEIAKALKGKDIHFWKSDSQNTRLRDYQVLRIGITLPKGELRKRIAIRLFARIRAGMIREARRLHKEGLSWKRMDELGLEYRYLAKYLNNKISKQEMIEKLDTEIWHYARRQMTWFRRDKKIRWFQPRDKKKLADFILKFLRI